MKAIVIRKPGSPEEALLLEDVKDPIAGNGEVIIKISACGVCAHDIAKRNGTLRKGIQMPLIPGHEVSGQVVEIGANVKQFKIGDRVATVQRSHICGHCNHCRSGREPLCDDAVFMGDAGLNGGYAEFVSAGQDNVAHVPDDVDLESASIAACAIGTMFHAICEVGRVRVGETVLFTGATGGLGMHGIQIAKKAGATVIAVTSSEDGVDGLKNVGADCVVVITRGQDFSEHVREFTKGIGVDVVIDNVGSTVFHALRHSLAKAGRYVAVGQVSGDFVSFNLAQLFLSGISLLSSTSTTRQELQTCLQLLRPGGIRAIIEGTMPLEKAATAHRLVEAGRTRGRILLQP
jgi:acryloyl-coenzyme A reductase